MNNLVTTPCLFFVFFLGNDIKLPLVKMNKYSYKRLILCATSHGQNIAIISPYALSFGYYLLLSVLGF